MTEKVAPTINSRQLLYSQIIIKNGIFAEYKALSKASYTTLMLL